MKLKKIILSGLLLSATIVLNRFLSINTSILSIGFTFVPLMLSGILLGYKYTALIATLADIIGALLFPFGSYFIGYTISSLLTGLTYGLLLYQKDGFSINKKLVIRLIISVLIVTILINGGLNTTWILLTVKKASVAIIPTRLIKQAIMIPIMTITMLGLIKALTGPIKSFKND